MVAQTGDSNATTRTVTIVDPVDPYAALLGAIIGTGLLGLTLYVKNSSLFAKFQHVNRIPKEFYVKGRPLKGIVKEITPYGLIKVEHLPEISLPRFFFRRKNYKNVGLLNLRLAGIDVSESGLTFISKDLRLVDKSINFKVIKKVEKNSDAVDADITIKKAFLTNQNLNVELVRKGFARIPSPADLTHATALQQNASYSRLITRLLTSEKVAERRGVGRWERSTWVESIKSLPSAATELVRTSPFTKFMVKIKAFLINIYRYFSTILFKIFYFLLCIFSRRDII